MPGTRPYVSDAGLARRVHHDRDQAAFAELARRHQRLIYLSIRGWDLPRSLTWEDMRQAALLGLWDACEFFLPGGTGSFEAFARPCIRHRLYYLLRSARLRRHEVLNTCDSLDAPVTLRRSTSHGPGRPGRDRTWDELLPAPHMTAEIVEAREDLQLLAAQLPAVLSPGQRQALARKLNGILAPTPRERMTDRTQMLRVRRKAAELLKRAA